MTLQECYAQMEGDLAEAIAVLETPERVRRYLLRFLGDPTARLLLASLEEGRLEDAFRAAHTLKGLCRGLGMTRLFASCSALTESLRAGVRDGALAGHVRRDYEAAVRAIGDLERSA